MNGKRSTIFSTFLGAMTPMIPLLALCATAKCDPRSAAMMKYVNVRDFGAVGDGKTDDTAAVQAAIASLPPFTRRNPFTVKPIYFPAGTYVISQTISHRESDGRYSPTLALIGESPSNTVIRLADRAGGFDDPSRPKPMLYFSSGLLGGPPTAGGKDYEGFGEGNDAYQNYVESLTVDTGRNNPGAVAIDYLANNIGAIRNVKIESPDQLGAIGIAMTRKWIGPALLRNVKISGFAVGIDVANTEYSVTLDEITVSGSRNVALRNTSNAVSFSNLSISAADGAGIENLTSNALIVGREARIEGKLKHSVINQGYMNLTSDKTRGMTNKWEGVYGPNGRIEDGQWRLPVAPVPEAPAFPVTEWADATQYGAVPDARKDSTVALQRAMDSGSPVICIPNGIYRITKSIKIPATVKRIEGAFSIVYLDLRRLGDAAEVGEPDQSGFVVQQRRDPLFVEHLTLRNDINNATNIARIAFLHVGEGNLIVRDVAIGEITALKRLATGGNIWAENMIGGKFVFQGNNQVWIRQLNTEGKGVRIQNQGSRLWILGSKTENNMTLLENTGGGEVELFGGLAYMVRPDGLDLPYIHNINGRVVASFAEEAFLPGAVYKTILESEKGGTTRIIRGSDMPERHHSAHIVPQVAD
jgi:hypothetical protein